jgi:hypothetical protein
LRKTRIGESRDWSELAGDTGRNQWGRYRTSGASMSMSGETQSLQLHRRRMQNRASPRPGVIGHGMRAEING